MLSTLNLRTWSKDRGSVTIFITETADNVQQQGWGLRQQQWMDNVGSFFGSIRSRLVLGVRWPPSAPAHSPWPVPSTFWWTLSNKLIFYFSWSGQFLFLTTQNPDTETSTKHPQRNGGGKAWDWIYGLCELKVRENTINNGNLKDPRMQRPVRLSLSGIKLPLV